ncbi:hypothetical protein Tco_0121088 [Tanacetum coccineum]
MQGVGVIRVRMDMGDKEVTKQDLVAKVVMEVLGRLLGDMVVMSWRCLRRTTSITMTAKLPILNPGDYDLWLMRIEQYFLMTAYSLWEVIKNGNKVLKRIVRETEQEYEPTTAEEKQERGKYCGHY